MEAPQDNAQLLSDCAPYVKFAKLDELLALGRANSLWPLTFGLACCAIEMMAAGAARFDLARFGADIKAALAAQREAYAADLERHFIRHLAPFAGV